MSFAATSRLRRREPYSLRGLVLLALGVLTATYAVELYEAASIVTTPGPLLTVLVAAFVAAAVLARTLSHRRAVHVAVGCTLIAGVAYLHWAPGGWAHLLSITRPISDLFVLATGTTILSIVALDVWTLAVTPGPVFLSWYFVWRSSYGRAAGVAMLPVVLLILTGDMAFERALVAILAAAVVVGCGELSRTHSSLRQADVVAIVIAAMVVASLGVSVVPAGPGGTGGGGTSPAMDASSDVESDDAFVETDGSFTVGAGPSLNPTVGFTVTADEPRNWRVDGYDRYTGEGWVRTGEVEAFTGQPIDADRNRTEIEVRTEQGSTTAVPSLYEPSSVAGVDEPYRTPEDGIIVDSALDNGTTVSITAARPHATSGALRSNDGPYPTEIVDRYTQLPTDVPDRVRELAANVTGVAESPHEAAVLTEGYLRETKNYSLDVSAPNGDVADEFLFEREAGYCVLFASTMAVMLRTQDVPARMVTGYSTGERVDDDRWVVRDMDAHAWVEVYIPSVGWVAYDPTPSGPYDERRTSVLADARADEVDGVDTAESEGSETTEPNETNETGASGDPATSREREAFCADPDAVDEGNLSVTEAQALCSAEQLRNMSGLENASLDRTLLLDPWGRTIPDVNDSEQPAVRNDGPGGLPPTEWMLVAATVMIGGFAAVRRSGLPDRVRYWVTVRWQGDQGDPEGAIARAWSRLETYLERRYGARDPSVSVRAYVDRLDDAHDLDPRIREVARTHEHARYGAESVDPAVAREQVRAVDDIVGVTGRSFRS